MQGGQEILQIRKDSDPISCTQSRQFVGKGYVVPANIRKMTQRQDCGSLPASYLQAPLHCLCASHLPCNRHLRARDGLWLMTRKVQAQNKPTSFQENDTQTGISRNTESRTCLWKSWKNSLYFMTIKPIKSNLKPAMCTWRLYSPVMGTVARIPFSSVTAGAAMAQLRAAEKCCGSTCTSCERQWISSIPNALNIAPFFSSDSTFPSSDPLLATYVNNDLMRVAMWPFGPKKLAKACWVWLTLSVFVFVNMWRIGLLKPSKPSG